MNVYEGKAGMVLFAGKAAHVPVPVFIEPEKWPPNSPDQTARITTPDGKRYGRWRIHNKSETRIT